MANERYKIYRDFSMNAETNEEGVLLKLEGQEAVENAIRQWISSFRGEYIRNPMKGGYITYWLMKPMNETTQRAIKESILEGFYEDFSPEIEVRNLEDKPDYDRMLWEIHLEGYAPSIKVPINVYEKLRILI